METSPSAPEKISGFEWHFLEKAGPGFLIGVPALVLLVMAIPNLATGYWADEVFSVTASRSLSGLFRMFHDYENNMSLYQVILYFWMRLFGESEIATHSLSLLVALVTLPLFFKLERNWLNKTTSFFGVLLLAVSPLFVFDAVEARSYAMLIMCVTISTLLFVALLKRPRYGLAVAYGFSVGISAYVHYFGVLIPLVHLFLLTRRTLTKKYLIVWICAGAVAVLVLSPLVLFPPKSKSQVDWIVAPDLQILWYVFSHLFSSGYVIVLLAACLVAVLKNGYWRKSAGTGFEAEKLALVWAFVPVLLLFAFSVFIKPLFIIRFFAWIVPGATLFTVLVVSYSTRNRLIQTALCCLILGIFAVKSGLFLRTKGSGFKESVRYLQSQVKPGDEVIVYPYFWALDVNYYLDQAGNKIPSARPVSITRFPYLGGGGGKDPEPALDAVDSAAKAGRRVFLICNGNAQLSKGDTVQTRTWLPRIRQIIGVKHPAEKELIFGGETQNPVKVLQYE